MKAKHEWSRGGQAQDYPQKCKNCQQTRWSAEDTVCVAKLREKFQKLADNMRTFAEIYEEKSRVWHAHHSCANLIEEELEELLGTAA